MMTTTVCIDTNVVVALTDAHDKWHDRAIALRDALLAAQTPLVYFDCVINEAIGVIGRRAEEQRRTDQFAPLLDGLLTIVPEPSITWLTASTQRLFPAIVALCRQHQGQLNFHDALIALACQELSIRAIVSFDSDFDGIRWLRRVCEPDQVQNLPPS
jgi:predicted nucleic acid-binding protein